MTLSSSYQADKCTYIEKRKYRKAAFAGMKASESEEHFKMQAKLPLATARERILSRLMTKQPMMIKWAKLTQCGDRHLRLIDFETLFWKNRRLSERRKWSGGAEF